ncbi:hypothetical protein DKX38_009595 [Salix brachista]|uniref:ethanolamine-phosphate cytidylyltransferase n=1 Tax=Salix brachista TaxID=2182728 RepID=A0A5N5MAT5_9ROSI|nr:hypothetical protein DKX38_009595 [Salix brachista]
MGGGDSDIAPHPEKIKIVATCLAVAVGISLLGFYLKSGDEWRSNWSLSLNKKKKKKPIRVYMDGCFDMMHYGHCNALRQARALGDQLVVGVVSDAEIIANKGPPVTPLHERMIMVNAVKWVDEVISDAPYAITEDFMKKLFDEYNIDYIIHGDDPCVLPDGTDAYALAKKAGRYKQIKRTEGVSSTDIVGRMLLCTRERSISDSHNHSSLQRQFSHGHSQKFEAGGSGTITRVSHFLPTSRRIVQFSNGKGPGDDARIVYIDGAFDLFHAGHVERGNEFKSKCGMAGTLVDEDLGLVVTKHNKFMRKIGLAYDKYTGKKDILLTSRFSGLLERLGDFLLVGIHNDQTVSAKRGAHRPIMNLHERSLSVLACQYVDEVIIGAPWEISKDMITTFNISSVVHGSIAENDDFQEERDNPYAVPISMGIFKVLDSPLDITTTTIIRRIVSNHEAYQKRNQKKGESEKRYYEDKTYVSGD